MLKKKNRDEHGFTLIELLMVILVIGVLAAIGITQFVNFGKDSRDATVKANLQILRRGIAAQNGMMRARCGYAGTNWPTLVALQDNDITESGASTICLATSFPNTEDAKFYSGAQNPGVAPPNPWSTTTPSQIVAAPCTYSGGWCYDSATGIIKANTQLNGGTIGTDTEDTF